MLRDIFGLFKKVTVLDNVVGVGQGSKKVRGEDTGKAAIVILVEKKKNKKDVRHEDFIPKQIYGLPTDVIEVGKIRLLNHNRMQYMRPAKPGVSIGHFKISAGTFGAVVKDIITGEQLILSNNHVLANMTNGSDGKSQLGDAILQPGQFDGGKDDMILAYLERFIPLYCENMKPKCKIATSFESIVNKFIGFFKPQYQIQVLRNSEKVNFVDCAVAKPVDTGLILPEILEVGEVAGIKEPQVGMEVKKSGRSSGVTHSIILATDVSLKVNISETEYGIFTDQVLAGPMSLPGDSGSLVLTEDLFAVGLLFAGSEMATMFNRIDNVLDALHVSFN